MIRPAATKIRQVAARIDAATPPHRDRTVDALRALAIIGVILGHWLVTALVVTHGRTGTAVADKSPLAAMPALTPVSWVFQTLAIFFLVGGYAAARSYGGGYRAWLRKRLIRLSRPVAVLAVFWTLLGTGLYLGGVPASTLNTVLTLVLDPLWFLGVFAVLTALTPLAVALARRLGAWAALIPLSVVAAADLVRFGLGGPSWVGWVNVVAGWLLPYLLGIAWARGAFAGWKVPALLLAGGVAATTALVLRAGYPASMVGVNGARISNLNPPTLAVTTFGIAQVGLALLLRPVLARWMRRPVAWAAVAMANLSAMTLFLWHQTAFLAVTMGGLLIGRLPGLHTAPAHYAWVAERLAWLPVFAVALAVLWIVFHRAERVPGPKAGSANGSAANRSATGRAADDRAVAGREGDRQNSLVEAARLFTRKIVKIDTNPVGRVPAAGRDQPGVISRAEAPGGPPGSASGTMREARMTVIIYADFNCPHCYLASQRADVLMRRSRVYVDWRAVEHDPGLPAAGRRAEADRPAWNAELAEIAGLALPGEDVPAAPPALTGNTAAAVAAYAEAVSDGVQHELRRRLFRAVWAEGRYLSAHEVRGLVSRVMTPPVRILPHLTSPDLPIPILHEPDPAAIVRRSGGTIAMDGDPLTTAGYRRIRRWRQEWLALPWQVVPAVIDPEGGLHPGTEGLDYLAGLMRAARPGGGDLVAVTTAV